MILKLLILCKLFLKLLILNKDRCSDKKLYGSLNPIFRKKKIALLISLAVGGFPRSSVGKESACNAGDLGSIPGSGRPPGEGNGNPLQYSCLESLMERGAWQSTVHGVARGGHNLVTKLPPLPLVIVVKKEKYPEVGYFYLFILYWESLITISLRNYKVPKQYSRKKGNSHSWEVSVSCLPGWSSELVSSLTNCLLETQVFPRRLLTVNKSWPFGDIANFPFLGFPSVIILITTKSFLTVGFCRKYDSLIDTILKPVILWSGSG